jgi:arylsulfatase A-like enzyme
MNCLVKMNLALATVAMLFGLAATPDANAQEKKPNIVVIMGDDIGIWNLGSYHQGLMAGRTPNLDKLAAEGMRFTDYYAEASLSFDFPSAS